MKGSRQWLFQKGKNFSRKAVIKIGAYKTHVTYTYNN